MFKKKSSRERFFKTIVHILLIFGAFTMLFPFFWMVSTSFKTQSEINDNPTALFPKEYNFRNYVQAWKAGSSAGFGRYFLNTIFVAVVTTFGQLILSSLAAYAFAFFDFPHKERIFLLLLGTMMIPQQALLVPDYIILHKLGWLDTYLALIIPWICSAFSVFLMRQFFRGIPKELFEASRIDGSSTLGFYLRILIPLSIPVMLTAGMFTFLGSWNSFIWPLIVTSADELRVIQVGLANFAQAEGTQWGLLMAASTFCTLPLIIGYFFVQKKFIQGIATSGMKD
jgi:multiple sugar transport system permease protein